MDHIRTTHFHDEEDDQRSRAILVQYYSSECLSHGAYIIGVFVGIFTCIQARQFLDLQIAQIETFHFTWFSIAFSFFPVFLLYFLTRILFWGYLTTYALGIMPLDYEHTLRELPGVPHGLTRVTLLASLHFATVKAVRHDHKLIGFFSNLGLNTLILSTIFYLLSLLVTSYLTSLG